MPEYPPPEPQQTQAFEDMAITEHSEVDIDSDPDHISQEHMDIDNMADPIVCPSLYSLYA